MATKRPSTVSSRVLQYCDQSVGDHNLVLEEWARKVVNSSPQPRHEIVVERMIEDMAEKERVGLTFNRSVTESMTDRWRALENLNTRFLQDVVNMEDQVTDEMSKSQKQIESFVANRTQVIMLKSKYEQMAGLAMHICFYKTVLEAKLTSLEHSFHFLQKCAETVGFNQPAQILDRYGALRAIFDEIFGEFEQRANVLNDLHEQYNTMVEHTIKQNMIKHNQMAEMHHRLKDIKSESTELERYIQSKLDLSSSSAVNMFKIKNSIFQVYARVMEYRGWEPQQDIETIDQLTEIETRLKITNSVVQNVHDAIMFESQMKKRRMIKRPGKGAGARRFTTELKTGVESRTSLEDEEEEEEENQQTSYTPERSTISYLFQELAKEGLEARESEDSVHGGRGNLRHSVIITGGDLPVTKLGAASKPDVISEEAEDDGKVENKVTKTASGRITTAGKKKANTQTEQYLRDELQKFGKMPTSIEEGRESSSHKLNRANPSKDSVSTKRSVISGNGSSNDSDSVALRSSATTVGHVSVASSQAENRRASVATGVGAVPAAAARVPSQVAEEHGADANQNRLQRNRTENSSYRGSDVMVDQASRQHNRTENSSYRGSDVMVDQASRCDLDRREAGAVSSEKERLSLPQLRKLRRFSSFEGQLSSNGFDSGKLTSFSEKRAEYLLRLQKRKRFSSLDTIVESAAENVLSKERTNQNSRHTKRVEPSSGAKSLSTKSSSHTDSQQDRQANTGKVVATIDKPAGALGSNADANLSMVTWDEVDSLDNSTWTDARSVLDFPNETSLEGSVMACPSEAALRAGLGFYLETMKRIFKQTIGGSLSSKKQAKGRKSRPSQGGERKSSRTKVSEACIAEAVGDLESEAVNQYGFPGGDISKVTDSGRTSESLRPKGPPTDVVEIGQQLAQILHKQHATARRRINLQLEAATANKGSKRNVKITNIPAFADSGEMGTRRSQAAIAASPSQQARPNRATTTQQQRREPQRRSSLPDQTQFSKVESGKSSLQKRTSLPELPHSQPQMTGAGSTNKSPVSPGDTGEDEQVTDIKSLTSSKSRTGPSLLNTRPRFGGRVKASSTQQTWQPARARALGGGAQPHRGSVPHFWGRRPSSEDSRRVLGEMCAARRYLRDNCLTILAGVNLRSKISVAASEEEEEE